MAGEKQSAVIIGGGSGIGKATAKQLLQHGYNVSLIALAHTDGDVVSRISRRPMNDQRCTSG